jgi:hypothetical protein
MTEGPKGPVGDHGSTEPPVGPGGKQAEDDRHFEEEGPERTPEDEKAEAEKDADLP